MKCITTKERLLNAILLAERITGKKESLPVLSCILIDVSKHISIRSTNLEAGIDITIPAEIASQGIIAVNAHVLAQTIRSIAGDKITLSEEDSNLLIESRGSKTIIKATPHAEFPEFTPKSAKNSISVSRDILRYAIQSVSYAASPSMIRPELGSVYISIESNSIKAVATDSFRLAEKTISGTFSDDAYELLIPLKHAVELLHILEHIDEEAVQISFDEAQFMLSGSSIQYVSRLIDGQFPNYKEIIPKVFVSQATVLKGEFIETLRKARVFSGNDQHIGLHVYPKKKVLSATARSNDIGEMSDSIDAALSGEDLDINFHIGYLSDCLGSIESDSITLSFSGAGRPLVIQGVSDTSLLYLVMPLNR